MCVCVCVCACSGARADDLMDECERERKWVVFALEVLLLSSRTCFVNRRIASVRGEIAKTGPVIQAL